MNLTREEVIDRMCLLVNEAHDHMGYDHLSDCFCGKGGLHLHEGYVETDYGNDGFVLEWVEAAVRAAIAEEKEKAAGLTSPAGQLKGEQRMTDDDERYDAFMATLREVVNESMPPERTWVDWVFIVASTVLAQMLAVGAGWLLHAWWVQ